MTARIGRNINKSDESDLNVFLAVSSTTSTTVIPLNENRTYIAISARKKDAWVKLQAASVDNDKKGIFIPKDFIYELHPDNIYTGEISVIADSGNNAEIYTTEF